MTISSRLLKSPGGVIAGLSAVSLAIVGLGLYLMLRPTEQSTVVDPGAIAPTQRRQITALGRLEPEGGVYNIAAPSAFGASRVLRVLVQEGQGVQQGQPLAVMDAYEQLRASALQAEAQVREAQSNLAQVRAGAKRGEIQAEVADAEARQASIRAQAAEVDAQAATVALAEANLLKTQRDLTRYRTLFKDGAIAEIDLDSRELALVTRQRELDQARRQLDQAKSQLDETVKRFEQAQQQINSISQVRPEDIQRAEAGIQSALANLAKAKVELEQAVVLSPIDGQVLEIHADGGEAVGDEGILDLGRTDRMTAVAEVYETDIRDVRLGQAATVTSPALPRELSGRVAKIALKIDKKDVLDTDPAADTDARVVEVTILLDESESAAPLTNLQVNVAIDPSRRLSPPGPSRNGGPPVRPSGDLRDRDLLDNGLLSPPAANGEGNGDSEAEAERP